MSAAVVNERQAVVGRTDVPMAERVPVVVQNSWRRNGGGEKRLENGMLREEKRAKRSARRPPCVGMHMRSRAKQYNRGALYILAKHGEIFIIAAYPLARTAAQDDRVETGSVAHCVAQRVCQLHKCAV